MLAHLLSDSTAVLAAQYTIQACASCMVMPIEGQLLGAPHSLGSNWCLVV